MVGSLNRDIIFITNNLLNQQHGIRIRWHDRQAVLDGFGQGQISGDGKEGDVAEGEVALQPMPAFVITNHNNRRNKGEQ